MKYSTHYRCPHGAQCPKLWRADGVTWNPRHGSAGFAARIPTSDGIRPYKKFGFESRTAAKAAAEQIGRLLDLAGDDDMVRGKIGDMITSIRRGAPLPAVEDVRRRLGLGQDPASTGVTFGQAWDAWLAGKKRLRPSSAGASSGSATLAAAGPRRRAPGAAERRRMAEVFDRIERIIDGDRRQAAAPGRSSVRRGRRADTAAAGRRRQPAPGVRRAAGVPELRAAADAPAVAFNPVYAVELEPEETPEAQRWTAAEAAGSWPSRQATRSA